MFVYMIKDGVGGACFQGEKNIEKAKAKGYRELEVKKEVKEKKVKKVPSEFDEMEKEDILKYALDNLGKDLDARKSKDNLIIEIQGLESKKMGE